MIIKPWIIRPCRELEHFQTKPASDAEKVRADSSLLARNTSIRQLFNLAERSKLILAVRFVTQSSLTCLKQAT